MDPLSVVASTITIFGATITAADKVIHLINHMNSASEEVIWLNNEVSDFKVILHNIEETTIEEQNLLNANGTASPNSQNLAVAAEMIELTQRARAKLLELETLIAKSIKARGSSGISMRNRNWLQGKHRMRMLREELKDIKVSLGLYFSTRSSTYAVRNTLLLNRVSVDNSQKLEVQNRQNEYQGRLLQDITRQLEGFDGLPEEQKRSNNLIRELGASIVAGSWTKEVRTTTTATSYVKDASTDSDHKNKMSSTSPSSTTTTETTVSRFKMEFSRFQKDPCKGFCSCSCHKRSHYRSPSFISDILGSLFVGLSSVPFMASQCSEPLTCSRRTPFSATFTYYFPAWLVSRLISLVYITTAAGDPAFCLKIRKVSYDFSMFKMASIGNLGGIRSLIDKRVVHPSAGFWGGWTPLHYAISEGHPTICRFLIQAGADVLIEDRTNRLSTIEWAWTKILGNAYPRQKALEFQEIFNDRECLEEMGFTKLHKIILGLIYTDLEAELLAKPCSANALDSTGRTALSWASQRGDTASVKLLLDHGADPNITSSKGQTPLHYAAEAQTPWNISLLLDYGASVKLTDVENHNALHYAVRQSDDLAYIKPLIEAGTDVNGLTTYDFSVLNFAIQHNRINATKYLLDSGADVNLIGQIGGNNTPRTPVFDAVEYNCHEILQLLWSGGADFSIEGKSGPTIMHIAASFADVETLEMLTRFKLRLANVGAVNAEGLTVVDLFEKRISEGVPRRFEQVFLELLRSIVSIDETNNIKDDDGNSKVDLQDDEETFYEALEYAEGSPSLPAVPNIITNPL